MHAMAPLARVTLLTLAACLLHGQHAVGGRQIIVNGCGEFGTLVKSTTTDQADPSCNYETNELPEDEAPFDFIIVGGAREGEG